MTTLTALMLNDSTKTAASKGALQRLRSRLAGGRRPAGGSTDGRATAALLRDVALGGTAATAANTFLKTLATGRRA
jgi:hypothetical protein